jgi:type 1 glutamine amidotransferase
MPRLTFARLLLGLASGMVALPLAGEPASVLVFSKTAGFRHQSIPAGIAAMGRIAGEEGWRITATEDARYFTPERLQAYDVVVFMNTSGDVLDEAQMAALRDHLQRGRGFVGVHAASDTEVDDPWYPRMLGARFRSHPRIQPAELTVNPAESCFPAVAHLPPVWHRTDEWYDFREPVPATVRVLLTLGVTYYADGRTGGEHPAAWYHEFEGGRVFYTAGGHTEASYLEPEFVQHLREGVRWAAGAGPAPVVKISAPPTAAP